MGDDVGMPLPVQLDHCVIHVSDWDVSNAFYRDVGRRRARRDERPPSPTDLVTSNSTCTDRAYRRRRWRGCRCSRATATSVLPGTARSRTLSPISTPVGWLSSSVQSNVRARAGRDAVSTSATRTEACSSSSLTRSAGRAAGRSPRRSPAVRARVRRRASRDLRTGRRGWIDARAGHTQARLPAASCRRSRGRRRVCTSVWDTR